MGGQCRLIVNHCRGWYFSTSHSIRNQQSVGQPEPSKPVARNDVVVVPAKHVFARRVKSWGVELSNRSSDSTNTGDAFTPMSNAHARVNRFWIISQRRSFKPSKLLLVVGWTLQNTRRGSYACKDKVRLYGSPNRACIVNLGKHNFEFKTQTWRHTLVSPERIISELELKFSEFGLWNSKNSTFL